MTVSVLVPFRAGCPYREKAWEWVQARYATDHPDWEVVTGASSDGPFNRSEAILNAAGHASGDVYVIADADVYCNPQPAVEHAERAGWAIPHLLLHRLSEVASQRVLHGAAWRGQPLSTDNAQDSKPYRGNETGTLVVMRREVLQLVPPDRRFVGWGSEDVAWSLALNCLIGKPWRGSDDLMHLWHPAQPRKNRVVGSDLSYALLRRYRAARCKPIAMRALIEEASLGFRDQARPQGHQGDPEVLAGP